MGKIIKIEGEIECRGSQGRISTYIDVDKVELLHNNVLVVCGIECWVSDKGRTKLELELEERILRYKS